MKTSTQNKKAFTLVELMLVTLISCFICGAFALFLMDSAKAVYSTTEKQEIANNVRQFIGEMETTARSSNVCYVYKSFNSSDRAAPSNRLAVGQSGDFVMFVTTEPDGNQTGGSYLNQDDILSITGYFRKAAANGQGPVYKFAQIYSPPKSTSSNTPEALIASLSINGSYPIIIQAAQGESNGYMFYNYQTSTLMVNANILQGVERKQVSNTLNFTVSPRG